MRLFAAAGRRGTATPPGPAVPLLDEVADALPDGGRALAAAAEAGRRLAVEGVSLAEGLDRLRASWGPVVGDGPQVADAVAALAVAWSETALAYVHRLGCEDPLTGLASPAHLRTRLAEVARADGTVALAHEHALVVVEPRDPGPGPDDPLAPGLALARLGAHVRDVFAVETVAALGTRRLAVLATRDDLLDRRVALLRRMLATLAPAGAPPRVWVEPLPERDAAAGALVEELVRS